MPEVEMEVVRAMLRPDPVWSLYALGDLAAARAPYCRWLVNARETGLILLYSEFGTPILFACGEAVELTELIAEASLPEQVYLHVRPELIPLLRRRYGNVKTKTMHRMALCDGLREPASELATPLGEGDLAEVEALYQDGAALGQAPDFFFPQMLADGTFFGIRQDRKLVAAAGTHIAYEAEGIAAIGHVYTHRDWRRRGFGRMVTVAVAAHLLQRGYRTIGLNVSAGNPARRIYEAIGFRLHCDFVEGAAGE